MNKNYDLMGRFLQEFKGLSSLFSDLLKEAEKWGKKDLVSIKDNLFRIS